MAMVDNFIKYGGYVVKKHDEENPFSVIEIEEKNRKTNTEEGDDNLKLEDSEEEDVIYLDEELSEEVLLIINCSYLLFSFLTHH